MTSVALFDAGKREKIPREMWSKRERTMAKDAARAALAGVGEPATDVWEDTGTIIVLRRQCRDEERRRVLEKYLSH